MRNFAIALATTASLTFGGVALAQNSNDMNVNPAGETSGTAAGGNVNPSTAVQKQL